jgi:hypothetical protein
MSSHSCFYAKLVIASRAMPKPDKPTDEPGTWIFRDIPRELMRRAKGGAALQGKSVRQLAIELMEAHLQELERKGILSRGKG